MRVMWLVLFLFVGGRGALCCTDEEMKNELELILGTDILFVQQAPGGGGDCLVQFRQLDRPSRYKECPCPATPLPPPTYQPGSLLLPALAPPAYQPALPPPAYQPALPPPANQPGIPAPAPAATPGTVVVVDLNVVVPIICGTVLTVLSVLAALIKRFCPRSRSRSSPSSPPPSSSSTIPDPVPLISDESSPSLMSDNPILADISFSPLPTPLLFPSPLPIDKSSPSPVHYNPFV